MDKKIEISIEKLIQFTNLSRKEIYEYLKFYNKINLLDLDITSSDIQLHWLKPREDNYSINPLIKQLEEISSIKKIKFKKIIKLIYDDKNCKTRQLLKYFGENKANNCMNCSSFCCK